MGSPLLCSHPRYIGIIPRDLRRLRLPRRNRIAPTYEKVRESHNAELPSMLIAGLTRQVFLVFRNATCKGAGIARRRIR